MNYNYERDKNTNIIYGIINVNKIKIKVDLKDLFSIINHNKSFTQICLDTGLPYYKRNLQKITYKEFIYDFNPCDINFILKNGDKFDLRRNNIEIYHKFNDFVNNNFIVQSYKNGHFNKNGKSAYIMKNPIWYVNEDDKKIILMYVESDTLIKLCEKSYSEILNFEIKNNNGNKLTFYKDTNGYITTHFKSSGLFIHQIITGCYGNGKGTKNISVDHIDQDPLNNTFENLRIASQKEQQENSKGIKEGTKRARKTNARELPNGITQEMIPKYVYYCKECYNKEKQLYREFFRIEKHPNMKTKQIAGSKSMKLSIGDKLEQIKEKIAELN